MIAFGNTNREEKDPNYAMLTFLAAVIACIVAIGGYWLYDQWVEIGHIKITQTKMGERTTRRSQQINDKLDCLTSKIEELSKRIEKMEKKANEPKPTPKPKQYQYKPELISP